MLASFLYYCQVRVASIPVTNIIDEVARQIVGNIFFYRIFYF